MCLNVKSAILKKQKHQGWGEIIVRDHLTEQRYDRGEGVRGNSMSQSPEVGESSPRLRSREAARVAGREGRTAKERQSISFIPLVWLGLALQRRAGKDHFIDVH